MDPLSARALIGVVTLTALTTGALALVRAPRLAAPAWAVLRGGLQLAAISAILRGVISDPAWVAVAIGVMFTVATVTVTRRLGFTPALLATVASAVAAGVGAALAIVFGTGALDMSTRNALAVGGIVIGGAMTTATLAGRRLVATVRDRWDEVEAWLALGATHRQSTAAMARDAVAEALVPATDQTRTTGLVTLPGAFVGAIFGGLSPLDAGRFQIVVLAAILAAGTLTAALLVRAVAPVSHRPGAL
ncbi:ABC transporter permease [Xylanimonas ulmi]|uniref:Putative ABC transport system permease protein n=1 Tax=Xylanimonas ulmi TaxID=228973 RepID=A0A4Q7M2N9_9MICO|nr:ABC transporter permease [Xylanibacterium ulmi]RZS61107.1 putative ABC transport system permease protein [Xylanibacterium ulmi]